MGRNVVLGPVALLIAAGAAHASGGEAPSRPGEPAADVPARPRLLARLAAARFAAAAPDADAPAACFVPNPTPEQLEAILTRYRGLPPTAVTRDRFFLTDTVWSGQAGQGPSGRALSASLTYSFPADNTPWVGTNNNFNQMINAALGAQNNDRGRELVRQAIASWRKHAGLTFVEVPDDNAPFSTNPQRSPNRGDVRIGAISSVDQANAGVLAFNFFPAQGADMTFISQQFAANNLGGPASNYRFFRNVTAHELGHGMGFFHVVPCNQTKLMEPFASSAFDVLQIDDRRGAQSAYGDRFSGNTSAATAADFGDLTQPIVRSVVERGLSTNRTTISAGTSSDWFTFTLSRPASVVIATSPQGGNYPQGEQIDGCDGVTTTQNVSRVGNLNIELRTGEVTPGGTVLQAATLSLPGLNDTVTVQNLPAGQYWVRVFDSVAPSDDPNQALQLYDFSIRVDARPAGPTAIAGLDKRCPADALCFFMGNINSEPGDNALTAFAWDLDGDGVFDSTLPQPARTYVSNGVYPIRLRVTDSAGLTDDDVIRVTITGAQTRITSITPGLADVGQSTPVTIVGTNFKGVTSAAQVTVSGNVTVTGTPVVNAMGTEITGLTFTVASGAAPGLRDVTITNADGTPASTATIAGAFRVQGALGACCVGSTCTLTDALGCSLAGGTNPGGRRFVGDNTVCNFVTPPGNLAAPCCLADFTQDGTLSTQDVFSFLAAWFAAAPTADITRDQALTPQDVFDFVSAWLAGCS